MGHIIAFSFLSRKPGNRRGRYRGSKNKTITFAPDISSQDSFQQAYLSAPRHIQDPRALSERKLIAAVLVRALCDAYGSKGQAEASRRADRRDALAWIASEDESPFSFVWICDLLDLKPNEMRQSFLENASQMQELSFYSQSLDAIIEKRYTEKPYKFYAEGLTSGAHKGRIESD